MSLKQALAEAAVVALLKREIPCGQEEPERKTCSVFRIYGKPCTECALHHSDRAAFAREIVAAVMSDLKPDEERERCARIAEAASGMPLPALSTPRSAAEMVAYFIAAAIRSGIEARGENVER